MTDKEPIKWDDETKWAYEKCKQVEEPEKQIIIDGVDVSKCFIYNSHHTRTMCCSGLYCKQNEFANCHFKQLARKTQEYENLKAEEKYLKQCCQKAGEELAKHSFEYDGKEKNLVVQAMELNEKYEKLSILAQEESARNGWIEYELNDRLKQKTQECEKLKEEILTKNEKIKELRFSVSDLTNRLCYLNAEKSFRIVDLERTLDEIEKELKEDIYCESQECGCDDFEECLRCTKEQILDIVNKAKGEENAI